METVNEKKNYKLVGHVKDFLPNDSFKKPLLMRIEEIANGGTDDPDGGILIYGNFRFGEYRVKTSGKRDNLRLFGNFVNGRFYVFGYGQHRDKCYDGAVFDKNKGCEFAVKYESNMKKLGDLGNFGSQAHLAWRDMKPEKK